MPVDRTEIGGRVVSVNGAANMVVARLGWGAPHFHFWGNGSRAGTRGQLVEVPVEVQLAEIICKEPTGLCYAGRRPVAQIQFFPGR